MSALASYPFHADDAALPKPIITVERIDIRTDSGFFLGSYDVAYTVRFRRVDGDVEAFYGDEICVCEIERGTERKFVCRAFTRPNPDTGLDAAFENAIGKALEAMWPSVEQYARDMMEDE